MTEAQARRLWDRASDLGSGDRVVEIGSYRGRSAIVLAQAADASVELVAIDPHAGNDRGPQQIEGSPDEGQIDHEAFLANLERAGVRDRIRHVRLPSEQASGEVDGAIDLLYIDGAHRYRFVRQDITMWAPRVTEGGTLLIHDSFSSVGVTLGLIRWLFFSADFRYLGRAGSMAEYRREPVRGAQRLRNALRQALELPWFTRNVVIKVLLVLRLRPLTRLLGHRDATWPY